MLINVQYEEAEALLWDLFNSIPIDRQKEFSEKVNRVASELSHPNSCGSVVLAFGGDGAFKPTDSF